MQSSHEKKNKIHKQNYKNRNVGHFVSYLRNINWLEALEINRKETNVLFIKYFDVFESAVRFTFSSQKFDNLRQWITTSI